MPLQREAKEFLEMLSAQGAPSWPELGPVEGRALFSGLRPLFGRGPEQESVKDYRVSQRFDLRVFRPRANSAPSPVLLYFHGGGWVLGDLETHDPLCRNLASQSQTAVVSVDYRRAPEHRHPAALDDCFEALEFVCSHAEELGVDRSRLAVAGDSAGGNLALGVALKARDAGGPQIAQQILIYPVVEPNFDSQSYKEFAEGFGLTREAMIWFWKQYTGERLECVDGYAVCSSASALAGLPPTHIITAEFDVLRAEGELLASRLKEAGVPTTSRRYDGVIHGFFHFNGAFESGQTAISDVAQLVAARLRA